MDRKVTKGIITAAGYGTRFLPATKNIPKELLPIINVPTIHYVVEEFVKSGIKDIIIVTRYGNHAVEDYFDSLFELEYFLKDRNKLDKLEEIRNIYKMANFAFVRQNKDLPYGNASPFVAAKPYIGNDNFAAAWGDDITVSTGEVPVIKQLIDMFQTVDCSAVIGVKEINREEVQSFSTIKYKDGSDIYLEEIIEKPKLGEEYSNLASFGRYVFSKDILDYIDPKFIGKGREFWLVDCIHRLVQDRAVAVKRIEGDWLTTGDPLRYLKTTIEIALRRNDLKDELLEYLRSKV